MVFSNYCATNLTGQVDTCLETPVHGFPLYRGDKNAELISSNQDVVIGGFNTTSDLYAGRICLEDDPSSCKFIEFYAALIIYDDT